MVHYHIVRLAETLGHIFPGLLLHLDDTFPYLTHLLDNILLPVQVQPLAREPLIVTLRFAKGLEGQFSGLLSLSLR
jgi:hypothetical protein